MALQAGQAFGNFRIVKLIGEGGFGEVYLAENPLIKRQAAVKVLLPELARSSEVVGRFSVKPALPAPFATTISSKASTLAPRPTALPTFSSNSRGRALEQALRPARPSGRAADDGHRPASWLRFGRGPRGRYRASRSQA